MCDLWDFVLFLFLQLQHYKAVLEVLFPPRSVTPSCLCLATAALLSSLRDNSLVPPFRDSVCLYLATAALLSSLRRQITGIQS